MTNKTHDYHTWFEKFIKIIEEAGWLPLHIQTIKQNKEKYFQYYEKGLTPLQTYKKIK